MNKLFSKELDPGEKQGADRVAILIENILLNASFLHATDVHIEPTTLELEMRFRIDGVLVRLANLPLSLATKIVARLKFLANLLSYRQDVPQEGRINSDQSPANTEIRVSTFPTIHGERIALRLFTKQNCKLELTNLGLDPDILIKLNESLVERTGAILFTGPGGSGKTTSIYSCLSHMVRFDKNPRHIVTLEDPVEQVLEGVSQTQLTPGSGFDFAVGLRSLLRQDPEVILVGEIRDSETARVAIEASLSGHLLFSSLHAGSSCGVISRLLDMGIEPYLLTSSLRLILNQRLLRKLCPGCKGSGCVDCNQTGYKGRFILVEVMELTPQLSNAILQRADRTSLESIFINQGGKTLAHYALDAIKVGITSREEVVRMLGTSAFLAKNEVAL